MRRAQLSAFICFSRHPERARAARESKDLSFAKMLFGHIPTFEGEWMQSNSSAWVYIMSSFNRKAIYIGVTNNLERRISEHKSHSIPGFTQKYNVDRLIYCEEYQLMTDAIAREKQLKGWTRAKKDALINRVNPEWIDLAAE